MPTELDMSKGVATSHVGPDGTTVDYAAIVAAWSPEERAAREKKFLRKIDYRLLPILVGILDRTRLSSLVC